MSPIAINVFRHIPTSLDINGPILAITSQPQSVQNASIGDTITFTVTATASFPSGSGLSATGTITYQWYDSFGPITNRTRTNANGTTSVISGATTASLSITNSQYETENQTSYYVIINYTPSAYSSGTTGNAINEPLISNTATLSIIPLLSISLQPIEILDGSTEVFSIFNISAFTSNSNLDSQIAYQWRLNGSNLSDSANVTGSRTDQLRIKQGEGTYTIDCVVTHPTAQPSPLNSNAVTYVTEDPRIVVNLETYDSFNVVNPINTTSTNLNNGPLNVIGRPRTGLTPTPGNPVPSVVQFIYAPEKDIDVLIEMAAAGGSSFGGVQGGQGGWGIFRMTLRQNVEYAIKLGSNNASLQPGGGLISGTANGAPGGGLAVMYEKNRVIAVLGGGGGAGTVAAGGDGGGFNQNGQSGFGRNGGGGGSGDPAQSRDDNFSPERDGGALALCVSPPTDVFRDQGLSQCSDYTQSGKFKDAATGTEYGESAILNRGFRLGPAGRLNGGWGVDGAGGAGGAGARGGSGSSGNKAGGGGGSGWADTGKVTVLNTIPGVNTGNAYMRIKLYDPAEPLPNPPVPNPPNYVRIDWKDSRNPGYKIGTQGDVGGSDQTEPGQSIKGPTGLLSSPPYNYAQSFDKYRSGSRSPDGIYFTPSGDSGSATDLSYVAYRLRFRGFGPRGGSSYSDGETIYLTSNRGNRDPNKGTVRKWYTQYQSVVDREPDKYTTSKGEAFVPFRIHFRLGFICEGNGAYRILYSDHYHDWYNFEYKDIDFDSQELASQNNLPRDGDKLIFPDFGTKTYSQPRIFELKSDIYNLDLNPGLGEAKNRINMFAEATRDDTKARESNFTEFGKYIIT